MTGSDISPVPMAVPAACPQKAGHGQLLGAAVNNSYTPVLCLLANSDGKVVPITQRSQGRFVITVVPSHLAQLNLGHQHGGRQGPHFCWVAKSKGCLGKDLSLGHPARCLMACRLNEGLKNEVPTPALLPGSNRPPGCCG